MKIDYKNISQHEYIEILNKRKKSFVIDSYINNENIEKCFINMEETLKNNSENLKKCYKNNKNKMLKLKSGNKKRMVFNCDDNSLIYGDLKGRYFFFSYNGFDFIINIEIDDNLKNKNFKTYSLNLSFLEKKED